MALNWLSKQFWLKPQALSIIGVSLGGVFLPISLHLSQLLKVEIEKSIFICTGADVATILKANLKSWIQEGHLNILIDVLTAQISLIDPKLHLPFLKGDFLAIQTDRDRVIPRPSQEILFSLMPNPKQEIIFPGPHINSDQTELIQNIRTIVLENY